MKMVGGRAQRLLLLLEVHEPEGAVAAVVELREDTPDRPRRSRTGCACASSFWAGKSCGRPACRCAGTRRGCRADSLVPLLVEISITPEA